MIVASKARLVAGWLLTAFLIWTGGCAHRKQIDWDARVGSYTFDEAVVEFGPPAAEALILDGRVADWILGWKTTPRLSFGVGPSYYGGVGTTMSGTTGGDPVDQVLRLTFNSEDVLKEWAVINR